MDNWVVLPCHNNSALLLNGLESLLAQTVSIRILAINNGSKDNVPSVLNTIGKEHIVINAYPQWGVAGAWNFGLRYLFDNKGAEKVLVVNQDILLRPDTYEILYKQNLPFVSAVSTGIKDNLQREAFQIISFSKRPHPDFSCYLISTGCYRSIGEFDETFYPAWFEDNDYHIRAARAGIELCCIDLPFYHYAAGTMKNADQEDLDKYYNPGFLRSKQHFLNKWGVLPGTKEYENMCCPKYWEALQ